LLGVLTAFGPWYCP